MKQLDELLETKPTAQAVADMAEFLRCHKNVLDNIKRYRSYLKRSDRKDYRDTDRKNLERHMERERIFKMVLEQQNK